MLLLIRGLLTPHFSLLTGRWANAAVRPLPLRRHTRYRKAELRLVQGVEPAAAE